METRKILNVDEIRDEFAGPILVDGVKHQVRQITLGQHQSLDTPPEGVDSISHLRTNVAQLVPTLTEAQLLSLTPKAAEAIITLAGAGMAAVERLFPNETRPEGDPISPA